MRKKYMVILAVAAALVASAGTVELKTDSSSCRVDLDGARIVSFRVSGDEMLWNDDPPQRTATDWAHGGIPLCWPRFGVDSSGAIHGVAWRRKFTLLSLHDEPLRSRLVLGLSERELRLNYTIVLDNALTLELTTTNIGTNDALCSYGLHPYLSVAERMESVISGIGGLAFEDDPSCPDPERGTWEGQLRLTAAIDRIFRLPEHRRYAFTLCDPIKKSTTTIESEGANNLNIWNPGPEKRCPGIVPGDAWRHFVCIEPIFVGGADGTPVPIPPGGHRTMRMTIRVDGREQEGARQ